MIEIRPIPNGHFSQISEKNRVIDITFRRVTRNGNNEKLQPKLKNLILRFFLGDQLPCDTLQHNNKIVVSSCACCSASAVVGRLRAAQQINARVLGVHLTLTTHEHPSRVRAQQCTFPLARSLKLEFPGGRPNGCPVQLFT